RFQLCKYSLTTWLTDNTTPESRHLPKMKAIFKNIVSGVKHIHSKNFIHRDLKPCNILFDDDNRLKIADMGILLERKIENGVETAVDHDGRGTTIYMSPEQFSCFTELDSKSDVFTMGLILAELCVAMDFCRKIEIFNNYRLGNQNDIFGDD
ncbi:hypothetical protein PENTCL1PPCAC_9499, partial [Pristionchus entomophagus]